MKWIVLVFCCMISIIGNTQFNGSPATTMSEIKIDPVQVTEKKEEVKIITPKWKIDKAHVFSGGLVFLAGLSKGFNETLVFHWKSFLQRVPKANPQWFNPAVSWRNKYKNGDPNQGPRSFLSTSVLIGFTDQYHLNNLVNRLAWTGAVVINIGGGKKPLKKYLLDVLYYSACNYAGFATSYYPFSKSKKK